MLSEPLPHLSHQGDGLFVVIEGNIGAGKSTLSSNMVAAFGGESQRAMLFPEPVDKPMFKNLLGKYYLDPARWGFAFQMYALKERLRQHTLASELVANGAFAVQDRSIYADGCFGRLVLEDGNMTEEEWEIYADTFGAMKRHLRYPDVLVYLRTEPEVCQERMKIRNRSEEAGVPLDYLRRLHLKHEELAVAMAGYTRVLVFDWNGPPEIERVIEKVKIAAKEPRLFMRDFTSLRA